MPTIHTPDDLIKLVRENAEFREALRRELLTDELLALPQRFSKYAEATDRRLDELTKRFSEYAEATDRRLDELTKTVAKLVRHAEATDRRLDALEQGQQRLEQSYQRLERGQRQHTNDIAELKGIGLETRLYNRGISQIATLLRVQNSHRIRVAERDDNSAEFNNALYEALEQGVLSEDEYARILDTDMVVRSNRPGQPHQVYVPIEASYSVSRDDIDKVIRTAGILDRLFPDAEIQPCLYFMSILDEMRQDAAVRNVHLIQERRLL